jgi:hypothetical protein
MKRILKNVLRYDSDHRLNMHHLFILRTHPLLHTHRRAHTHTHTHTHPHTHTHTYAHTHTYTHTTYKTQNTKHTHTHTRGTRTHTHRHIHTHTHTRTHTHTHTHSLPHAYALQSPLCFTHEWGTFVWCLAVIGPLVTVHVRHVSGFDDDGHIGAVIIGTVFRLSRTTRLSVLKHEKDNAVNIVE